MRIMGRRASEFDTETIEYMLRTSNDEYGRQLSEGQLRELRKTLELRQKDEAE